MTIAEKLRVHADAVNAAAGAEATLVMEQTKAAALDKIESAAGNGAYSVLLKPGGANSGYLQPVVDYLVPHLESLGFTVTVETVPSTITTDFALLCSW